MGGKAVVDVFENDVLLGRGKRSNNWPGNIRFRKLVDAQQKAYMTASNDVTRDAIAYEIANSIERQGGRFLRETVMEVDGVPRSAWMVVEGATIRTKVKQALRDSAKAKARESAHRDESVASASMQSLGSPQGARGGVSLPSASDHAGASTKRSSHEAHLGNQEQDQKRPAVVDPVNFDPRVSFAGGQNQMPWRLPTQTTLSNELFRQRVAEQQLRSAIEREQQLSLLRTLASGQPQQHQQILRMEEERRSLAAALELRRATELLANNMGQVPYRGAESMIPPTTSSSLNLLDPLRWINEPASIDALAALRLRQSLAFDPSVAVAARQLSHTGPQFDLFGASQPLLQQQLRDPLFGSSPPKPTEDEKAKGSSDDETKSQKEGNDDDDEESSSKEDNEKDRQDEA